MKHVLFFVSGFLFAILYEFFGKYLLSLITTNTNPGLIISGYRYHHSLYGVLSFLVAVTKQDIFWLAFGVGIIVQHTIFDGFWFITREV